MDQIDRLIIREGGNRVVYLRGDGGKVTKYGISSRAHPDLDIENLTHAQAREIYFNEYLKAPKIDLLPQPLQEQVFDFAVHSGPVTAIKKLQTVLNLPITGNIDEKLLGALNNIKDINNALVKLRILYLLQIERPQFWRGWIRRALGFMM